MKNIVYFDLETQKSAEEVGGWDNISRMGMSIGVTYSTAQGAYRIYGEKQVSDLITDLQRADLVVGFNHLRFDYEVLHGYTSFDLRQLPTLDMMVKLADTVDATGFRWTPSPQPPSAWKRPPRACRPFNGTRRASCSKSPSIAATT